MALDMGPIRPRAPKDWRQAAKRRAALLVQEPETRSISDKPLKTLELPADPAIYTRLPAVAPESAFIPSGGTAMRNAAARSNLLVPEVREVMDIRQASGYLGISPDTLYKYASEGFVPAFKLGNRWRFKRSRLDEWMDRQSDLQAHGEVNPEQKKPVKSSF